MKKTTGLLLLALCLHPVAVRAEGAGPTAPAVEQKVDGCGLVKAGEYKTAVEVLRQELALTPDNPKLNLCLGVALNRLSDRTAAVPLKRALMEDPASPAVNYELGLHYYKAAVPAEAADYFETVIQLAPDGNYATAARDYLQRIEEQGKEKLWSLEGRLGLQSDSNVILNGKDQPFPEGYSGESDWRAVLQFQAERTLMKGGAYELSAGYSLYQSKHAEITDFDITQNLFGLDGIWQISPKLLLKGGYDFEYLLLGGDAYDTAHILSPGVAADWGDVGVSSLTYTFRTTSYSNTARFPDNSTRNGENHQIAIAHLVPLGKRLSFWTGYVYDTDVTDEDYWNYRGHKYQAGVRVLLPWQITADLSAAQYDKVYQGDDPAFLKTREDDQTTYSLALSRPFNKVWSVTAGLVDVENSSNLAPYDYVRTMTSLFVIARY